MNKPGVGIVGAGGVADYGHALAIRKAGGELVAIADLDAAKAQAMAEKYNVERHYGSHHELLARDDIQIVSICTRSNAHKEIAIDALKAGKNVYIEKPPTESAEQMRAVADVASDTGLWVWAGSHHPARENVMYLKNYIEAGKMGDIYMIEATKLRHDTLPIDNKDNTKPGGIASGSSSHRIDVALFVMGLPKVTSVTAVTSNKMVLEEAAREGRKVSGLIHDTVMAIIQFDNGCSLYLRDIGYSHYPREESEYWLFGKFAVYGTKSAAELHPLKIFERQSQSDINATLMDLEKGEEFSSNTRSGGFRTTYPDLESGYHVGHVPVYEHLYACLREGKAPDRSAERACMVMQIEDAIYESAAAGGRQILF